MRIVFWALRESYCNLMSDNVDVVTLEQENVVRCSIASLSKVSVLLPVPM